MAHKGIDYSGDKHTNRDIETGIRYGVINMNDLAHWAWDDFESDYGPPTCPECGNEVCCDDELGVDHFCTTCLIDYDGNTESLYGDEPLRHELDDGKYKAEIGGQDNDCFVVLSPYYTRASFCSPCAPGACSLSSPCFEGEKAYCFGLDFFDASSEYQRCPYPIWRVEDDSPVYPPTPEGLALMQAAIEGDDVAELAFKDYLAEHKDV